MRSRAYRPIATMDACVRLLKTAHRTLHVVAAFCQRFRIPLTSLGGEEVASIDMDGASESWDRIGD